MEFEWTQLDGKSYCGTISINKQFITNIKEIKKETEKKEMGYDYTFNFGDLTFAGFTTSYPTVKSIKYDKNYTTVIWNDGTKTTVRCSNEDEYSRYTGFCSALAKKIFGTSSQVRKLVETKDEEIELAKKKAERKEEERLAEITRKRKERHQIKYRAKQIVIEKKAKQLAKQMLRE
jgi:hypothetical protein